MHNINNNGLDIIVYCRLERKKIAHEQAFTSLVSLKDEWRLFLYNKDEITVEKVLRLEEKTTLVQQRLIAIDDSCFNILKRKHYMKVELSKYTTKYPFIPIFIMKFYFMKKNLGELKKITKDAPNAHP